MKELETQLDKITRATQVFTYLLDKTGLQYDISGVYFQHKMWKVNIHYKLEDLNKIIGEKTFHPKEDIKKFLKKIGCRWTGYGDEFRHSVFEDRIIVDFSTTFNETKGRHYWFVIKETDSTGKIRIRL